MHINSALIFSKDKLWIDIFIKSLFEGADKFELIDEDSINKYLGVDIRKNTDGLHKLRQPFLTQRILDELNLSTTNTHNCLILVAKPLLYKDLASKLRVQL